MSIKKRAKNHVAEQCFDVPKEELGLRMGQHYDYLCSLNNEWNSMCAKAIRNYLPNELKIQKLQKQNKILMKACDETLAIIAHICPDTYNNSEALTMIGSGNLEAIKEVKELEK